MCWLLLVTLAANTMPHGIIHTFSDSTCSVEDEMYPLLSSHTAMCVERVCPSIAMEVLILGHRAGYMNNILAMLHVLAIV